MKETSKGYLLCLFGVFTWSFREIFVKLLQGSVGPISLAFLQFFFASIFMFMLMFPKKDTSDVGLRIKQNKISISVSSIIGLGFSTIILFAGIQMTQANIASAIYTVYPVFVSIYGIFIVGERTNIPLRFLGLLIGFIGTAILITEFELKLFFQSEGAIGNIMILISAAMFSFFSVLGKKVFQTSPEISNNNIKYNAIAFSMACVPILIVLLFSTELSGFMQYTPFEWMIIIIQGFFSTAFGVYVFFIGIKKIDVSKGMSLALLKPIFVVVLSYFILGELPTIWLFVSIPIVSIAVIIINLPPIKKNKQIENEN